MTDRELREHIEETGKVLELFGLTPMQGRILAYLASAEKPLATFTELVDFFSASKSSISTSLSHLQSVKMIDYKTIASERRKYFYLTGEFFLIYFTQVLENLRQLKELCYKTVSTRSGEHPEVSNRILKWVETANVFETSLEDVIEVVSGNQPVKS